MQVTRRAVGMESTTARRASSCANATRVGETVSTPRRSATVSEARPPGTTASTSHRSAADGITASCSTASRVGPSRSPSLARTASATVCGTPPTSPDASTSATKNGLPEVTANTCSAVHAGCPHRADGRLRADSRAGVSRRSRGVPAARPSSCCSGWSAGQFDVPVGQHQHGRQADDPPYQEPQHVQGRLVGPVNVLDDEYSRLVRPVQLGPQGVADPTAVGGLERVRERAARRCPSGLAVGPSTRGVTRSSQ